MIDLIDIYSAMDARPAMDYSVETFLWELLLSRPDVANISHRTMPTWEQHIGFIHARPYHGWYLIVNNRSWVGSIYLTSANEIGLHMMPGYRGKGFGRQAVDQLIGIFGPGRYLANIAPANYRSQEFFEKRGFRQIQATYELVV